MVVGHKKLESQLSDFLRLYKKGETREPNMTRDPITFIIDSFSLLSNDYNGEDLFIYEKGKFKKIQFADI